MKIIAIDYGVARTGVAVCDVTETIASPLCVIPSYNEDKLIAELCCVIKESGAEKVIIGRPLKTNGTDGSIASRIPDFVEKLRVACGFTAELVDERFTTVIAAQRLHDNNKKAKAQKSIIDAAAAAVLLQGYIDGRK